MTVDAATDSEIFDRFVREALVPVLKAGDVVELGIEGLGEQRQICVNDI